VTDQDARERRAGHVRRHDMSHVSRRRCVRCQAVLRRTNDGDLCSPCARAARVSVPTLPAGFYTNPDVVAALADYEFGRFFRIARTNLRMTQEQFGLLVGLAQSRICKIENGIRLRDIESVARFASVLGTPPDLLGFNVSTTQRLSTHRTIGSARRTSGAPTQQTRQRSSRS
jgi:transcriptional regulator with XRE-family HTH domain